MERILLDPRSALVVEPQLSLLYGQIETAQQFLIWLVQGCTPEELVYRGPLDDRNSIGTLVLHIAGCNVQWVYKLFRQEPVPARLQERFLLHDGEGPLPEVTGLTAAELLDRHRESLT